MTRGDGREKLLVAALSLIGERGLHAVTLRDVAGRAQMSLGSTTYHFQDRTQLIQIALERFASSVVERCDTVINGWDSTESEPAELLAAMMELLGGMYADRAQAFAQIELYVEASRVPELAVAATQCVHAYVRVITRALRAAGVDDDEQAALRARRIVTYLDGLALQASAMGADMTLPEDATPTLLLLASSQA